MSLLLDTDTCASIIRQVPPASDHFARTTVPLYLSAVSVTELEIWLLRHRTPLRYRQPYFTLQQGVTVLNVTEPIAHRAALLSVAPGRRGPKFGLGDALVAATALEQGLTLVTHSGQRFANIAGLTVLDWAVP